MLNNILAASIAKIKNAGAAKKLMVVLKNYSTLLENVLICLKNNGYIANYKKFVNDGKITLIVKLAYYQSSEGEYMKNYIKDISIDEFFEENKDKMFDMKTKISTPNVPHHYMHSIKTINNKSTGGRVIFSSYKTLLLHREKSNTFGILILTTSQGVLSHVEAIKNKVGGKILMGVY